MVLVDCSIPHVWESTEFVLTLCLKNSHKKNYQNLNSKRSKQKSPNPVQMYKSNRHEIKCQSHSFCLKQHETKERENNNESLF